MTWIPNKNIMQTLVWLQVENLFLDESVWQAFAKLFERKLDQNHGSTPWPKLRLLDKRHMQTVWQRRVFISWGILIENIFVRFGLGFPNKTYKKRFGNQNLWFTGMPKQHSCRGMRKTCSHYCFIFKFVNWIYFPVEFKSRWENLWWNVYSNVLYVVILKILQAVKYSVSLLYPVAHFNGVFSLVIQICWKVYSALTHNFIKLHMVLHIKHQLCCIMTLSGTTIQLSFHRIWITMKICEMSPRIISWLVTRGIYVVHLAIFFRVGEALLKNSNRINLNLTPTIYLAIYTEWQFKQACTILLLNAHK